MKLKMKQSLTLVSFLMIAMLAFGAPSATIAQEGHHEMAENQCEEATQTETVVADPDDDGSNTYDITTITTETGTCLGLTFENHSGDQEHSWAIESDDTPSMDHDVHLHLMNSSSGHREVNLQMPDEPTTITFFCNVTDHADDGMVGQIVVEDPDAGFLPGFGLITALAGLTAAIVAVPLLRRRNA